MLRDRAKTSGVNKSVNNAGEPTVNVYESSWINFNLESVPVTSLRIASLNFSKLSHDISLLYAQILYYSAYYPIRKWVQSFSRNQLAKFVRPFPHRMHAARANSRSTERRPVDIFKACAFISALKRRGRVVDGRKIIFIGNRPVFRLPPLSHLWQKPATASFPQVSFFVVSQVSMEVARPASNSSPRVGGCKNLPKRSWLRVT